MKKLFTLSSVLLFVVASFAQINGDYRTKASGTWLAPETWETYNGTTWVNATLVPNPETMTVNNTITVGPNDDVTFDPAIMPTTFNPSLTVKYLASLTSILTGAVTKTITFESAIYVETPGTLKIGSLGGTNVLSATLNTGSSMVIESGGVVTVTGTLANNSSLGVDGLVVKSEAFGFNTGSLIHGSGTPAATVERGIGPDGWHFVSPSTTGVTPQNFYMGEGFPAWLTSWDEPTGAWTYFVDPLDTPLLPGTGYSYWWDISASKEMTSFGVVEFKGNLFDPAGSYSVTLTEDGPAETAGFNMVGNPWPCAINVDPDLINSLTNCEESVWIWSNVDEWYEWAALNGPATGNNIDPFGQSIEYIAVGQGALLRALSGGGSVDFTASERIHQTGAQFYKESEEVSDEDINPIIQLLLTKNDRTDRANVMFGENGSTGFENGYDVTKMFGSELNSYVYLNEEDHNYAQNYLSTLEETEERVVSVYVRPGSEGEHAFTVNMEYIPNTLVVLEDTETGTLTEMNNDVVYTFIATPGDNENRFKMHFTSGVTGIENPESAKENAVNIYAYDKAVYISNNDNSTYETAKVSVYDMYGRQIYFNQMQLENVTRIPVSVSNSYLIVKVVSGNKTYNEKVFIK